MEETEGRRGRQRVVETEEFEKAVDARAAAVVAEQMEAFKRDILAKVSVPASPENQVMAMLAVAIEKLGININNSSKQGQYNKPISIEESQRREDAHNRMVDLIMHSRTLPVLERPEYRIVTPVYLNERRIQPYRMLPDKRQVNNEVRWTGVPNRSMVPVNDMARQIYDAWDISTGGRPEAIPTADQRPYYMTSAGLTVKGDPPKRQFAAGEAEFADDLTLDNSHPEAPDVAVLGTVAKRARQNLAGVTG